MAPVPTPFASRLRGWRLARGFTQQDLDRAIGRGIGFIRHLETDELRPPDLPTCLAIGTALGVPGQQVWAAARLERLRSFDMNLAADFALAMESAGADVSGDGSELVERLRWLDEETGDADNTSLADHLGDAVLDVLLDVTGNGRQPTALGRKLVAAIRLMAALPVDRRLELIAALVAVVDLARPPPPPAKRPGRPRTKPRSG